jgi:hypothetical protein
VRLTDFWDRMEQALGSSYARSWASDFKLSALQGRSVNEALADGEDAQVVWRAVHQSLDLEAKFR